MLYTSEKRTHTHTERERDQIKIAELLREKVEANLAPAEATEICLLFSIAVMLCVSCTYMYVLSIYVRNCVCVCAQAHASLAFLASQIIDGWFV